VRATAILRHLFARCAEEVHRNRFEAVLAAVDGLLRSQRLSVTAMGREASPTSQPRYGIKRIDRLVGNARLQREIATWYAAIAHALTVGLQRVVVLIDWTQIRGDHWALVATVAFQGRSFPILARSYLKSSVGNRVVESAFVRELRSILPKVCRPVVVTDAGFRSPFFEACNRAGVDYVIRLRNSRGTIKKSCRVDGERIRFAALFKTATESARCLGLAKPYAGSRYAIWGKRVVLGPKPLKADRWERHRDDYERRRGCEPFLLVTSLDNEPAHAIVAIYEKRMQIEETFRDTKNPRFGWALSHSMTRSSDRFNVLLLLGALAAFIVMLVGAASERRGYDRSLRASSSKERVLSNFSIGNLMLRFRPADIHLRDVIALLRTIVDAQRALFPKLKLPRVLSRYMQLPVAHSLFCADCGFRPLVR
jgi:predicted small integral membrane protein